MQKQPSEGFLKKGFMRIFAEFTKNININIKLNINGGRIGKQNRKLLKRAVQVKEQVSEAVVRRLQIRCS